MLLTLACIVLVVDVYVGERVKDLTYLLGQASVVIAAVLCLSISPTEELLAHLAAASSRIKWRPC